MLSAHIRRSGGSLILTIPQAYIEQNHLQTGSKLSLEIEGEVLKLKPAPPTRSRKSLAQLLKETPEGLQRVEDWDNMQSFGAEV